MADLDYAHITTKDELLTVPNSIAIPGTSDIVVIDGSGDLSPEFIQVDVANGIYLFSLDGATAAQYAAAALAYAQRHGLGHEGAGGSPSVTPDESNAGTVTPQSAGTWTPA